MIRKVIKIDEEKCNGCGLCVNACHESALALVDGKARLTREDYCDGLGNCLPACPTGAISFEEREAAPFVAPPAPTPEAKQPAAPAFHGCPGTRMRTMRAEEARRPAPAAEAPSRLAQWPCQLRLVPTAAPFFENADLLIAADCAAYAFAGFHERFMKRRVTLIGCPKLDDADYAEKLAEILRRNEIRSITIARMEVPCCGGLVHAVQEALRVSGKVIPWRVATLSVEGELLED